MLRPTYSAARLSSRLLAVQRSLAPTKRSLHASARCAEFKASSYTDNGASSSSKPDAGAGPSSSSSAKQGGPLSMTNIVIATAAIVVATPYALDLYGSVSGTSPSRSSSSSSIPGKLEPYTHHPLPLATSNYYPDPNISSNHKLLQIALPASTNISSFGDEEEDLKKRLRIRSVYIKEPSLVIERAYTPLYDTLPGSNSKWLASATAEERRLLDLLVKKYPDGELGRMLHRARPNPIVPQLETRGPVDTWSFERDSSTPVAQLPDRIVMVVGGTGITPAYQLLTNLFGRPATAQAGKAPKIDVLYATPDIDNALLLPQLHALAEANKDKVSISLFAERLPSSFTSPTSAAALGPLTPSRSNASRSWIPFFSTFSPGGEAKLTLISSSSSSTTASIPVYESRITQQHLERALPLAERRADTSQRTLILVCGPDGMLDALAGPKARNGQTQGPLRGVLTKMGVRQENVFKL